MERQEREREERDKERERERERDLKLKFCKKQFLCDLFLPKEILIRNFITIDPKLNIQWQ